MRGEFLLIPNIRNKAEQIVRGIASLALAENKTAEPEIDSLFVPEDSKYLFSDEIYIDSSDEMHNIDFFKLPSTPEISDYWYEKISNFYTDLSTEAKTKRFHTSVEKFENFSKSHQRLLLATNGRTISYGAVDRQTN